MFACGAIEHETERILQSEEGEEAIHGGGDTARQLARISQNEHMLFVSNLRSKEASFHADVAVCCFADGFHLSVKLLVCVESLFVDKREGGGENTHTQIATLKRKEERKEGKSGEK